MNPDRDGPGRQSDPPAAALVVRDIPLRRLAATIHGFSSQLTYIDDVVVGAERMLAYTFNVAGRVQIFHVPLTELLESIADLYPEAAAYEQALARRLGLAVHRGGTIDDGP